MLSERGGDWAGGLSDGLGWVGYDVGDDGSIRRLQKTSEKLKFGFAWLGVGSVSVAEAVGPMGWGMNEMWLWGEMGERVLECSVYTEKVILYDKRSKWLLI